MRDRCIAMLWCWQALRSSRLAHPLRLLGRFVWLSFRDGLSLYTLAKLWAHVTPTEIALVDDNQTMSWYELLESVDALVGAFHSLGLRPSERVGVMCRNHNGFVLTLLASMRLGVDVVLINTRFDPQQLDEALARQKVGTLILDPQFDALAQKTKFRGRCFYSTRSPDGRMIGIDLPGLIASKRFMRLERRPAGALIVLTSGTTSIAKGVRRRLTLVQLAGVVHSLTVRLKLHCHERTLITVPLFHGYGIAAVALAMGLGSPMGLTCHTDGRRMRGRAIEFGARTIVTVPTLLRRILDASSIGTLDSLQRIISGSAPLPSKVVHDMVEQLGPVLYNLYGSTEAGLISIASPADLSEASTTVGFPVRGTGITIRGNAEETLPWGQSGEVVVSSRLVFEGYTHDSVPISFTMGFGTGDRGVIDEAGRLCLLGRIDEILIIGGENIHPQQVEHRLLMLPQVIDAAVAGVDDDSGILQMAAWLVLLPGSQIEQSDFAAVLPAYMRPSRWQLVDQLPRNAIGKLERYHLPKSIGRGGDVKVHCR